MNKPGPAKTSAISRELTGDKITRVDMPKKSGENACNTTGQCPAERQLPRPIAKPEKRKLTDSERETIRRKDKQGKEKRDCGECVQKKHGL
jgi:hypothetical protein